MACEYRKDHYRTRRLALRPSCEISLSWHCQDSARPCVIRGGPWAGRGGHGLTGPSARWTSNGSEVVLARYVTRPTLQEEGLATPLDRPGSLSRPWGLLERTGMDPSWRISWPSPPDQVSGTSNPGSSRGEPVSAQSSRAEPGAGSGEGYAVAITLKAHHAWVRVLRVRDTKHSLPPSAGLQVIPLTDTFLGMMSLSSTRRCTGANLCGRTVGLRLSFFSGCPVGH